MSVKTILAAASGGTASEGAIELACRLARRFGAHLEAFHARPDPRDLFLYSGDAMGMSMTGEFIDRFIKDADTIVNRTKASFEATIARHQIRKMRHHRKSCPEKRSRHRLLGAMRPATLRRWYRAGRGSST